MGKTAALREPAPEEAAGSTGWPVLVFGFTQLTSVPAYKVQGKGTLGPLATSLEHTLGVSTWPSLVCMGAQCLHSWVGIGQLSSGPRGPFFPYLISSLGPFVGGLVFQCFL